ncbi:MAG: AAA family ATPase [Deltaproteobacteria bacterium]|nr:AAA family ATPase [Deltaproteobacteria bacterium]
MGRMIVVVFGLMGSGKSSRSRALAASLDWPVIHSDVVRKNLAGLKPTNRVPVGFGQGIYGEDFSTRTYDEMLRLAKEHLDAGCSVILDGSYKRAPERARVRQLAREQGVQVLFVYCECPAAVARERLGIRLTDPEAISDGRVELFADQARDFDPFMPEDRPLLRLDTNRDPAVVLEELKSFVQIYL